MDVAPPSRNARIKRDLEQAQAEPEKISHDADVCCPFAWGIRRLMRETGLRPLLPSTAGYAGKNVKDAFKD